MKQVLERQQKTINSMFKRSKKSFGNSQASISELSNFLSGASTKLKKLPKPKKSELEKLKLKDFSNILGQSSGNGGGGGGLLGGLGGLAAGIVGGKAAKGAKGLFDKKVGKEIAEQGTEKVGKVAAKQFGKEAVDQTAKKVGGKTLEKGAAKMLGKKVPIVGAALGTVFAVERAMRGDWLGATGELASGIASTIPGAGTAVSLGIDAALIAKDVKSEGQPKDPQSKDKLIPKSLTSSIAQQSDIKTKQRMGMAPGAATAGSQMMDIRAFERVVEKFGQLINMGLLSGSSTHDEGSAQGDEGGTNDDPGDGDPYNGPIDGNQFWPLPGGVLSNRSNGYPGGEYGAPRSYPGGHSGQDIGGKDAGSPVVAWKTGKVSFSGSVESGDTIITIDHGGGIKSVYKHVVPTVQPGETVYGGQQVATLFNARAYAPHLHFEVWRNGSHTNPVADLSQSQKISAPLDPAKAKQHYEKSTVSAGGSANPSGLTYTGAAAQKSTVIGDSIGKGLADQMGAESKFTQVGADVKDVRRFAEQAAAEGKIGGKNIVLSSGISNNTSQLSEVRELIRYLQSQGAAGVQLAGTSNDRTDLKKMNPKLQALAMEFGGFVQFGGGFAAADKIHPDYAKYSDTLRSLKTNAYNQQAQAAISSIYKTNTAQPTQVILGLQQPSPQQQSSVPLTGGGSAAPAPIFNWNATNPDPLLVRLGQQ